MFCLTIPLPGSVVLVAASADNASFNGVLSVVLVFPTMGNNQSLTGNPNTPFGFITTSPNMFLLGATFSASPQVRLSYESASVLTSLIAASLFVCLIKLE